MNILAASNKTTSTIMLVIGILCLLLAFFVIFLYKRKISKEKNNTESFRIKETQTKYKIFHFWGQILYIFIIFTGFVGAIILITIGISSLI